MAKSIPDERNGHLCVRDVFICSARLLSSSLLWLFLLAFAPALESTELKSYPITTLINAKWGQTPLYMEIAEYIADENPGIYWDFLKGITELETPLNEYETESKQYLAALSVVRSKVSTLQLPLLKLVVAVHSLTPRIQAHLQIADDVYQQSKCKGHTFAQVASKVACSFAEMRDLLDSNRPFLDDPIETYGFDHVFPGSENNTVAVVLYADIGSREFQKYHEYLVNEAVDGKVKYVARHYLTTRSERLVRLSGYGVELHLKSTEYKSQDDSPKPISENDDSSDAATESSEVMGFDFKTLKARFPALSRSLDQFRHSLLQGNEEIAQLKAWEFQDLGLQATTAIAEIQGEEALQILQFTAQNFPQQARTLLNYKVKEELRQEVRTNTEVFGRSLSIVPPDGALLVNGLLFDPETFDLNSLIESLRTETRVLETLHANNVRGALVSNLLALDLSASSSRDFALDIRDTAIMWINDIESDAQYRRWPGSVMDLLRPTFPGMLRNLRKNMFNLVLIVDPVVPKGRSLIKLAESFVLHQAPVRLGLVFDGREAANDEKTAEAYRTITCAFNYITQKKNARSALSFLTDVFTHVSETENVSKRHIRNQLRKTFDSLSNAKIDDIIDEESDYDYGRKLAQEFVERLGFNESPQALLNGVPISGTVIASDSDFEEAIFSQIMQQTSILQKAVYRGDLTDSENLIDYLMNQPHVMPRLNQRILSDENVRFIDLSGMPQLDLSNARGLAQLSNRDMTATLTRNLKYFSTRNSAEEFGNGELHFLTLWVFADLDTEEGRQFLLNALRYAKVGHSVRLAFIPNCEGQQLSRPSNLNRMVWAASQTMSSHEGLEYAIKWIESHSAERSIPKALQDVLPSTELHMKMLRVYAQRVLNLGKSERLLIANGKILGPLGANEQFTVDDFGLIDRFNALLYGDKIRKVLRQTEEMADMEINSDILLKLYTSLVPREAKIRYKVPEDAKDDYSVLKLPPKNEKLPYFDVTAVIDPASRNAQKLAPILILLRNILNCKMRVFMIPVVQHSDMPVKNFYRYVVEPEVQFMPNGQLGEGPQAKFTGVPANPLLTQNLQAPENWLVEIVRSVYDLDNIKLSEIGGPVHSEYELEYLLLEGHCFDSHGTPPRGLQITLGTKQKPVMVDTIVMANLGYFQLKANPGIWELRLREGKSQDIYEIAMAEGPNTIVQGNSTRVVLSSLRSHVIKLRVTKKPGMQGADLLGDDNDASPTSGIWNSIASSFGGSSGDKNADEDTDTINIFSVASGHLYERLLRIMMVSLLKHTKSPVKFWFLKNYLSPQFIDFLPHMAREYGFQYELVQYKWPRWLHQQTEKQRTIWGYKILFLDVLFPLNVRKIIFVDADAIVRTDLKELYDLDLGGAPYAYTPFCDSRQEMEGFRFWKQGYWRSHLMGRRYHISALYVVDLKRFRKIAAGDRLRGQYQALSQDPNSLSNLDQDLPNNMIHQVAIKSLPDEWLWCETWCNDASFKKAKVIDLCNNPQTKEAKLTAAQRIVPEWKDYDQEIKALMGRIEDRENLEHLSASSTSQQDPHASRTDLDPDKLEQLRHSEL